MARVNSAAGGRIADIVRGSETQGGIDTMNDRDYWYNNMSHVSIFQPLNATLI